MLVEIVVRMGMRFRRRIRQSRRTCICRRVCTVIADLAILRMVIDDAVRMMVRAALMEATVARRMFDAMAKTGDLRTDQADRQPHREQQRCSPVRTMPGSPMRTCRQRVRDRHDA